MPLYIAGIQFKPGPLPRHIDGDRGPRVIDATWIAMTLTEVTWTDILGFAASAAVLATFCMGAMVPLRIIAIVSNVLFILYGYFDQLYPVLVLHVTLLPMNMFRLLQFHRSIRNG